MSVLAFTPEVDEAIARCVEHAKSHVISWPELQARATGAIKDAVGDDPDFVVDIPVGYRACFSYEMQRGIKCRHLSISVGRRGKLPHEQAVHELCKRFGFTEGLKGPNVTIWLENLPDGYSAINVLEAFVP